MQQFRPWNGVEAKGDGVGGVQDVDVDGENMRVKAFEAVAAYLCANALHEGSKGLKVKSRMCARWHKVKSRAKV